MNDEIWWNLQGIWKGDEGGVLMHRDMQLGL